jgi:hypothetical protein
MGTWQAPDTKEKKAKLKKLIKKIDSFKKELAPLFGDDEAFDYLDLLAERLTGAVKARWSKPANETNDSKKFRKLIGKIRSEI